MSDRWSDWSDDMAWADSFSDRPIDWAPEEDDFDDEPQYPNYPYPELTKAEEDALLDAETAACEASLPSHSGWSRARLTETSIFIPGWSDGIIFGRMRTRHRKGKKGPTLRSFRERTR